MASPLLSLFILVSLLLLLPSSSLIAASNNSSYKALSSTQHQQCVLDHFSALLHLKLGFIFGGGYSITNLSSWNPDNRDCCSWEGITCDPSTGNVIGLHLGGLRIEGRIDFESLFLLRKSLQRLDFSDNYLDPSPIPSEFDQLTSLTHLNLSHSNFYGQIPLGISRLTSLVSLDLSLNSYFNQWLKLENPSLGALVRNMSSLRELRLDMVEISAVLGNEWGPAISSALPNLSKLSMVDCALPGPIHPSLFQLQFLTHLDLSSNDLSSVVPHFTGSFSPLTSLYLKSCGLHGKLPESIFRLPRLEDLVLSDNPLLVGGKVPRNITHTLQKLALSNTGFCKQLSPWDSFNTSLKQLTHLALAGCNLSGPLPPSRLLNLSKLLHLDLSSNNFTGPIPSSYGRELQNLQVLGLHNNSLGGTIPSSLLSLPSLQVLSLSDNQLNGPLGKFHNASSSPLEHIILCNNNLQGPLPSSISQLKMLQRLNLSSNHFSGLVDLTLFQNLSQLEALDLSYNKFSVYVSGGGGNSNSAVKFLPQLVYLHLRSCNIAKFPDILRNQTRMQFLDLSDNKIKGQIPEWIWTAANGWLNVLNLSHNALEGLEQPIPHLSLRRLAYLDLSFNRLQGAIPIPPHFTVLFSLSHNEFTGEVPSLICNAKFLEILDLSENHLRGLIPKCLEEIGDTLDLLKLGGNTFHGPLLQTFKVGCNLRTLDVNQNQLEGHFPSSLANCKRLEVLNVGNNRMVGKFPFWLGNLPQLRVLVLRSNQFHGTLIRIPMQDNTFPLLQIFDISFNSFTGNLSADMFWSWKEMMEEDKSQSMYLGNSTKLGGIPYQDSVTIMGKGIEMKLIKILTAFTLLDLSNNKFQGAIPISIGNLKSLRLINMSHNCFDGKIPASLGNLSDLESLDLSRNELSGAIPWQLTKLTWLSVLNLSQNFLEGSIPRGPQFNTFTNESFQGNLGLCGFPLSKKCKDESGPPSKAQMERKYDWEFMWIGFGVGHGVGIGIVFWTLALWRNGRRACYIFIDRMFLLIVSSLAFSCMPQRRGGRRSKRARTQRKRGTQGKQGTREER